MTRLVVTGNIPTAIGIVLIALGLVLNEFVLAQLSADGAFSASTRTIIRVADVCALVLGAILVVKKTIDLRFILSIGVMFAFSLVLLEAVLAVILHTPSLRTNSAFLPIMQPLYWQQGPLIQYSPGCAQYDPVLSYRLRPGECTFSTLEFSTRYAINKVGFRDDEASMDGPEIVVLGDSQAMGWGVEQDETFAEILEKKTGRRVANVAVSSFGTARELMALKTIDSSNLKTIIIQYSDNDYAENRAFAENGGKLHTMSPEDYACLVKSHQSDTAYFPGRYTLIALKQAIPALYRLDKFVSRSECAIGSKTAEAIHSDKPAETDADLVRYVLRHGGVDLEGIQVIFVEVSAFLANTEAVDDLAADDAGTGTGKFTAIDVREFLLPADFYALDGHLNASGHQKIADVLAATVASE